MSRIFDALRKSENDRADSPAGPVPQGWRGLAGAVTLAGDAIEKAPRLQTEGASGNQPAAAWHGPGQEIFRVLHHRLELMRRTRPLRILLVTSAIPKEGKTTIAVNLAVALARASVRVLLVDADLRHPGVHRALGLPPKAGLADLLENRLEWNASLCRVEPYGFFYLTAGATAANPGELLGQPEMRDFLVGTASQFDWVVVDSPPLIPFVDAHRLVTVADGVLLVVRQGLTPRPALERALGQLDRASIAGTVLNGAADENHGYYGYYGGIGSERAQPPAATSGHAGGGNGHG